jgi:hypothetical protein
LLYRVFPYIAGAAERSPGGALHVPRGRQGAGRHDYPDAYGALYASRAIESAIAERIQGFRGQTLTEADLRSRAGGRLALATFDDGSLEHIVDLDDPEELSLRNLRPSAVATQRRPVTREIALRIFIEGANGFAWWSTLESAWANVTLFAERASADLRLARPPELLTVEHPSLRLAADAIGVRLA